MSGRPLLTAVVMRRITLARDDCVTPAVDVGVFEVDRAVLARLRKTLRPSPRRLLPDRFGREQIDLRCVDALPRQQGGRLFLRNAFKHQSANPKVEGFLNAPAESEGAVEGGREHDGAAESDLLPHTEVGRGA